MNRAARKYYNNLKSVIPSRGRYERKLLKNHKEQILILNNNNPDITYDELQQHLGNPREFILEYYENVNTEYLIKRLRTTKLIRRCVFGGFALIMAVMIMIMCMMFLDYRNAQEAHGNHILISTEDDI